jgi:hypothetical protein
MRARNVFEKGNPEAFALFLEGLFTAGLSESGVQPYLIRHRLPSPDSVHIEIVLHSAFDLPHVERFIEEEFVKAADRPPENGSGPFYDLSPIEFTLRLGPVRQELPEWKNFAALPFLVTVNTLFGEAFRAALSYLSGTGRKEGLSRSGETLQELFGLAKKLDSSFSRLFSSFEKTEQELLLPDPAPACSRQERGTPERQGQDGLPERETSGRQASPEAGPAAEGGISPREAAAFLAGQETTLGRLVQIAEENGIELSGPLPPFEDGAVIELTEGFRQFAAELRKHGLERLEDLEDFFRRRMSDWEDLYAGFELIRLKGLLDRGPVSLPGLLSLLLQSAGEL